MKQLHKKFTDYQIKELITRYLEKKLARKYIQDILGIKKTRFFALVKRLKDDPENFSISYSRRIPTRKISKDIEINIVKELKLEKDLIKTKDVPNRFPRLYRHGTFKTQALLVLFLPFLVIGRIFGSLLRLSLP